jgi:parallel beta-helix repeat protein
MKGLQIKQRMKREMFLIIFLLLFSFIGTQLAPAVTLSDSGWSDATVGTWDGQTGTLIQDLYETVQIVSDDITLDGNGHTITGSGTGSGVWLLTRTNVTIKNLKVENFESGIEVLWSSNITLMDNTVTTNGSSGARGGIFVYYSNGCSLTDNTANSNTGYGIYLYASNENALVGNTASHNTGAGIRLWNCSGNTLTGNTADSNGVYGIRLDDASDNNVLTNNTTNSNSNHGIYLNGSSYNTLAGNTASNSMTGINLPRGSNNNILTDNTISNNEYGLYIWLSNDNEVYNNNFTSNLYWHAYVSDGSGNVFNLDKPFGGNYWDDWTTPDADCDGFVDEPYVFSGGQDNLPWARQGGPVIALNEPTPSILWPPNHTFVDVSITGIAFDLYDPDLSLDVSVEVIDVEGGDGGSQHEPDYEIKSATIDEDGNIEILVALRAECSVKGDGRIYEIVVTVTDTDDNSATDVVHVLVPHD